VSDFTEAARETRRSSLRPGTNSLDAGAEDFLQFSLAILDGVGGKRWRRLPGSPTLRLPGQCS
jgi:hypothetical protein